MKKLDYLVIRNFAGPFLLTFFIALFVLVLQFLWKYVDDLIGKGLDHFILAELLFYASAKLVPLALPLAMLLSSIMTLGSFGEHLELTAIKSSGISLFRFIRPLILVSLGVSLFAFFFSNNILPLANLKFSALLYDIRHQKPAVAIKEKIFFNQFDRFYLRVEKKSAENDSLYGITIYDHSSGKGNDHVITAGKGFMQQNEKDLMLQMHLENGFEYREMKDEKSTTASIDAVQTEFQSWEKRFDLSEFTLNRSDENFFRDLKQMLDLYQLTKQLDTIQTDMDKASINAKEMTDPYFNAYRLGIDTLSSSNPVLQRKAVRSLLRSIPQPEAIALIQRAQDKARTLKGYASSSFTQIQFKEKNKLEYIIEVHRKFTLSFACLILFFIGAPLGSIIRKGGLGWPLFYAVVLFILYHVSSMMGEKMAKKDVLSVFSGMWLSSFILLPLGLLLTLKATQDSRWFEARFYHNLWIRLFRKTPA